MVELGLEVLMVLKETQDLLDPQDQVVLVEMLDRVDSKEIQDPPVPLDPKDSWGVVVYQVLLE